MTDSTALFDPITIRGMELRNRIVRSATAENMAGDEGTPRETLAPLYRRLADGEVGLLITGHCFVRRDGKAHAEMTGIHEDRLIEPFAVLADAVHAGGGKICAQINHGGRACDPGEVDQPVAPSAVPVEGQDKSPHELTEGEIASLVQAFTDAARRVQTAGFDAVQIHAAHGYLVSQFLSPLTNKRRDGYGGSLENRARFLKAVAAAVRKAVGETMPVLVKLGVTDNEEGGLTVEEGAEVASWLRDFGIDAIETSTAGKGAIVTRVTKPEREAYLLHLAEAVKAKTDLPVIAVGGLRSRPVMDRVLASSIDMISMCRPLIREPDLPKKLRLGETDKAACVSCNRCWPKERGEGIACRSKK
ncbi:MAG: oxidoreductase [Planctomycetota bacterium]|jgi:2,4-dienoyl-CoA reductase-like NADH-dependent reductase (Old Yellow Enzyme family)